MYPQLNFDTVTKGCQLYLCKYYGFSQTEINQLFGI